MANRGIEIRQTFLEAGFPHSRAPINLNQESLKKTKEGENRVFGVNHKAARAAARAEALIQREAEFCAEFPIFQFYRVATHIIDGKPTPEEMSYFDKHIDEYATYCDIDDNNEVPIIDFERREEM